MGRGDDAPTFRDEFPRDVAAFAARLRRRQVDGSLPCARGAAEMLRTLVTRGSHPSGRAMLDDVRKWGVVIQAAKPLELSIGNTVRRVLHMIREECVDCDGVGADGRGDGDDGDAGGRGAGGLLSRALRPAARSVSLHNLLDSSTVDADAPATPMSPASDAGLSTPSISEDSEHPAPAAPPAARARSARGVWSGRAGVIEQVNELIDELDEMDHAIAMRAGEHIHANEIVLTLGHDATTLLFLTEAAKKRAFQVVVAEGWPSPGSPGGAATATALAAAGIETTLVSDAAVFAVMARIHKVVLAARSVLANGGVMAAAGAALVAAAAKRHAAPVVALVGSHALSPLFPHDPALAFNELVSPGAALGFAAVADAAAAAAAAGGGAQSGQSLLAVHVPALDYVPPELVSLLVTDTGGATPAYVYRLLADYYSREDYALGAR